MGWNMEGFVCPHGNVGLFWTTCRVGPPAALEILATSCQNILSWIGNYFCLSLVKTIMPHVTCLIKIARPYKLPFQSIRTSSKCCLALREYPPLNLPPTKIWLAIIIANVCVDINCRSRTVSLTVPRWFTWYPAPTTTTYLSSPNVRIYQVVTPGSVNCKYCGFWPLTMCHSSD